MTAESKNIILVDDHIVVRNGLKELIEKIGLYHVTHEYDNGQDFINALPFATPPDLVILDISMPEKDGNEVVSIMNEKKIDYPVLILTLSHDENNIIQLFREGIRGYLEKDCTAVTLKAALEDIFQHGYYHNDILYFALRNIEKPKKSEKETILEHLTEKELEFLRLVCDEKEYTYDQIAGFMGVVRRTVDGYREAIFEKFNIKSKTGLVMFAIRKGLF